MRLIPVSVAVLLLLAATGRPASAQQEGLTAICDSPAVEAAGAREACLATAQAVASSQPSLGIVIAGGNPTIGSAGASGLRLGILPRFSAGLRVTAVGVEIPDLLEEQLPGEVQRISGRFGVPVPALSGDVSIGVFPGLSIAPGIGGIGGISVLGSASVLPFQLLDVEGFDSADMAWGLGARLHLVSESFILPGVSLSLMRRQLPDVGFGNVCRGEVQLEGSGGQGEQYGVCIGEGDVGEFTFDLSNWSTRLVASKRLLGIGATLGLGHDRYSSDIAYGFRGEQLEPTTGATPIARVTNQELSNERWTVFGNLSYTLLVGTVGLEAGWQQGDAPISGFRELETAFNPRDGSWYGSLAVRLAL